MSEEFNPKAPALLGDLKEVMDQLNDALKKRDEYIEKRFNESATVNQRILEKLDAMIQPAGTTSATGGIDKNELINKAIDKIADRYFNNQPESELDSMSRVAVEIAKREAVGALKLQIRRGVRKGLIFETEVEEMIGHKLEEKIAPGAAHGPPV